MTFSRAFVLDLIEGEPYFVENKGTSLLNQGEKTARKSGLAMSTPLVIWISKFRNENVEILARNACW